MARRTANDQAVFIHIPTRGDASRLSMEWEDQLAELLGERGEVDGSEIGEGWLKLFIYGSEADAIVSALWSFATANAPEKAYVVVRRGPPGSTEETISLRPGSS